MVEASIQKKKNKNIVKREESKRGREERLRKAEMFETRKGQPCKFTGQEWGSLAVGLLKKGKKVQGKVQGRAVIQVLKRVQDLGLPKKGKEMLIRKTLRKIMAVKMVKKETKVRKGVGARSMMTIMKKTLTVGKNMAQRSTEVGGRKE